MKEVIIVLGNKSTFEQVKGMIHEALRTTYGGFLNFEAIVDEIHASEIKHGNVLLYVNYTLRTAELLSANPDVQALGKVLQGMGFEIKQSHDGHQQCL